MSRALIEYVAPWLLDHPEDLEINEVDGDDALILELTVHPEDMGKIIGKRGRIIHALRSLARAGSGRGERPILVEVSD
ncbi:MAG TPA: KH domain-containing protein [Actinomycetota bacterium]|nr:KH domain-containing protein [Actinomycetota bacterium]